MLCFGRVGMVCQELGKIVSIDLFGQGVGLLVSVEIFSGMVSWDHGLALEEHP